MQILFSQISKNYIFYLSIILIVALVLYSNPFLRYPYDMFHHLIIINEFNIGLDNPIPKLMGVWINNIYFMIPTGELEPTILSQPRYLWHYCWAWVFNLFSIDSTQMFLSAKIIHIVQIWISFASIYYFSHVILRNVFKNIPLQHLRWLSLGSLLIWLSIYATFSVVYHQVWIMWYSINYQISLPLFWYMLGLTLVLFLEENSWKIKLFLTLQILLISRFILQVHSMEFMYYLMHMSVFFFIFIKKIPIVLKKYFFIIIPIILAMLYIGTHYRPAKSPIFNYLSFQKLPELYEIIMREGTILLGGLNRASASINEFMYLILYFTIFFIIYLLWHKYRKVENYINIRMFLYVLLTSMFILIPLYQFSGGLFSIITYTMVVNRLYYSSSLFILLPIFIYYIAKVYNLRLLYVNIFILFLIIGVYSFSKYNDIVGHNYYKNIQSIKNSFNERKVGYNLSKEQIQTIKEKIHFYEHNNTTNKPIKYYARADIAFVLKYMYKKDVNWEGRFGGMNYKKNYARDKNNQAVHNILFEVPEGFPLYKPYL